MPIESEYVEQKGVHLKASGKIACCDLLDYKAELYTRLKDENGLTYLLVDLCDLDKFDVSRDELGKMVEQEKKIAEHFPDLPIAYICSNDMLYGIGRMLEVHMAHESLNVAVFRNIDDARSWVESTMSGLTA